MGGPLEGRRQAAEFRDRLVGLVDFLFREEGLVGAADVLMLGK